MTELTATNLYRNNDLEAVRGHESETTSAAINTIAKHTGATQSHVLRGDDKTEREIFEEHKTEVTREQAGDWGTETANLGIEHIGHHAIEFVMGRAGAGLALPLTLAKAGYDAASAVVKDGEVGHERAAALPRDTMHAFLLGNLNGLPKDFVSNEMARYPKDVQNNSFAQRLNDQLGKGDNALMAIAQLHCDQGMAMARAMCDAKQSPAAYLAANPAIAKRCAEDPAFKTGFDAVVWANQQGPEVFKAVVSGMESRDARYEQAHVAWRA